MLRIKLFNGINFNIKTFIKFIYFILLKEVIFFMKKTTKIILTLLYVLFGFAIIASCDNKSGEESKENANAAYAGENAGEAGEAQNADDGLLRDNVPALNFGGYEYRILWCDYGPRGGANFYPESEEGEILNDTIYKRNQKIQERFNVKLKAATVVDGQGEAVSLNTLVKNVQAGADEYDMQIMVDREATTAAGRGLLYPISGMEYIDLSQPYWLHDVNNILTVGGKLAWAFSEEMLSVFENTLAVFYNKKQAQDFGFEDLYKLVGDGRWTFDKFFEYAKAGIKDVDGDGKMGKDDYWGITAGFDEYYPNFWIGAGILSVEKDENDMPYFSLPGNARFLSVAQKIFDAKETEGMYIDAHTKQMATGTGLAAGIEFFKSGYSVFLSATIQEMVKLRDMPDDFGVVPFPKYDDAQSNYCSRISGGRPFVIPATNQRPDIAGALMEAMACETRNTVYPAYYESSLKIKFSRDPETVEMLDLVRDTLVYDLGDTIWYEALRSPLTAALSGKNNTIASWIEKNEAKIANEIQKTADAILGAY